MSVQLLPGVQGEIRCPGTDANLDTRAAKRETS